VANELTPGLYEKLITAELQTLLQSMPADLLERRDIEHADSHEILTRHIARLVALARRSASGSDESERIQNQLSRANAILDAVQALAPDAFDSAAEVVAEARELMAVLVQPIAPALPKRLQRPEVPLSTSALLVNSRNQPRVGSEIQRELASADRVDLLCAFVKWNGVRILDGALQEVMERRGPGAVRVITTTYIGATERRAVDRLVELGAQVRVSYETRTTRLHAKAWLFHRATDFSTAYVGSSNLSRSALLDGLEWNVRLSSVEQPHVIEAFAAAFDDYWNDPAFEEYEPSRDAKRLDAALAGEHGGAATDDESSFSPLRLEPYPYQREILDGLEAERTLHERWRNLVVMATGTGKTVVAALDYVRLREAGIVNTLLFVAHRDEILRQSRSTYRHAMRDGTFGEELVGGRVPSEWQYVFASVQSLSRPERIEQLAPGAFDMVVIDEFHHSEAATYRRLLDKLEPKVLLGLTATPERADGQDVTHWFGGRIAVELRLWEAIDQGLLCPFQYFGIHDDVDLSHITWRRGQYDLGELSNVYTGHDARAAIVTQAVRDKIGDPAQMRALGFCVSVDHAEFMARRFIESGIPATAVSTRSTTEERRGALRDLRARRINAVFAVDLFNEGLDVPDIDTVLFLRPTESATVFLQQLGRGLRLADDKPCLTVLDFVGNQHARFRFDLRYRALTGLGRRDLERAVQSGFPYLPSGCHIDLDREVGRVVLASVARSLHVPWKDLARELREGGDIRLAPFLAETGLEPVDLYRRSAGGWTALRRLAGHETRDPGPADDRLGPAIARMLHIDDTERLGSYAEILEQQDPPTIPPRDTRRFRQLAMLHVSLWGSTMSVDRIDDGFTALWSEPARKEELLELLHVLADGASRVTPPLSRTAANPAHIHGHYTLYEALAAFGDFNPGAFRQGVRWLADEQADLLFVTLKKTERHYSATTMYKDRAITPSLFHWESQSTTTATSPTGQRYQHHRERGSTVHLFVRESREGDGALGAPPYLYAGPCSYASHQRERPMAVIWHLEHELPPELFQAARALTG
jgi:superfamily II DNA or RNA helicase